MNNQQKESKINNEKSNDCQPNFENQNKNLQIQEDIDSDVIKKVL